MTTQWTPLADVTNGRAGDEVHAGMHARKPVVYITVGPPNSGKSHFLATETDAVDVCLDDADGMYHHILWEDRRHIGYDVEDLREELKATIASEESEMLAKAVVDALARFSPSKHGLCARNESETCAEYSFTNIRVGVRECQARMKRLMSDNATPLAWGNTNAKISSMKAVVAMAVEAGYAVEFVVMPRLPLAELMDRNLRRLWLTGKYIPIEAIVRSQAAIDAMLAAGALSVDRVLGRTNAPVHPQPELQPQPVKRRVIDSDSESQSDSDSADDRVTQLDALVNALSTLAIDSPPSSPSESPSPSASVTPPPSMRLGPAASVLSDSEDSYELDVEFRRLMAGHGESRYEYEYEYVTPPRSPEGVARAADNPPTPESVDAAPPEFSIASELYAYQQDGVMWMHALHTSSLGGGILADEMGLGKTVQVASFLESLAAARDLDLVLLIVPVAVVESWCAELAKWAPRLDVLVHHGGSAKTRARRFSQFTAHGGPRAVVTTYGVVRSAPGVLAAAPADYVILDEGHRIKNASRQISRAVRLLSAKHKLILTGTPVQNNLEELWALMDYLTDGLLLGDLASFRNLYANPIRDASASDASYYEKRRGAALASTLRETLAPYILRREKADVLPSAGDDSGAVTGDDTGREHAGAAVAAEMPEKKDVIAWIPLSTTQHAIYEQFLESDTVAETLNQSKSPLAAIDVLKKICSHPFLLASSSLCSAGLGLDANEPGMAEMASGKVVFLLKLLRRLAADGHRVLLFSQSLRMLDLLQGLIAAHGYTWSRIDGSVSSTAERQGRIDAFNAADSDIFILLMTTQSCGVGVTLTGADRVVLFDPQWNPAMDAQAVDRAYRIGQTRDVVVFRLICAGTVEEKIYRKQVFKGTLIKAVTEDHNAYRYFTKSDLADIFALGDTTSSQTMDQLNSLHAEQREAPPAVAAELDAIAAECTASLIGFSDHDLLFSKAAAVHFEHLAAAAEDLAFINDAGSCMVSGDNDSGLCDGLGVGDVMVERVADSAIDDLDGPTLDDSTDSVNNPMVDAQAHPTLDDSTDSVNNPMVDAQAHPILDDSTDVFSDAPSTPVTPSSPTTPSMFHTPNQTPTRRNSDDADDSFCTPNAVPSTSPALAAPTLTIHPETCAAHRAELEAHGEQSFTPCLCYITAEKADIYAEVLALADDFLNDGELSEAHAMLGRALELCDSDLRVRLQYLRLGFQLHVNVH
ncbi:chromatin remodeling complex subunit [Thecamonas trahens ATCC 50062]|uniref:Chromatin remodeling complex subunit n=1 Tax=Thecamonas trahens ATCC 50062 TaxID=461836 RepID=A0A0L0DCI8_THETB|nr:chromatin remodeling complex subunit [Thecamonas trahens ATCC 50062]KNC49950.1 chromatin remodeling complex subunit [Thecamonas trahens ATCC 50062]|eukprot:XP_013757427.1 chromatin remodeling complex subunit [Thecamonas trahens ATCC 50062]